MSDHMTQLNLLPSLIDDVSFPTLVTPTWINSQELFHRPLDRSPIFKVCTRTLSDMI